MPLGEKKDLRIKGKKFTYRLDLTEDIMLSIRLN